MKKWTEIPFVGLIAGQICIVTAAFGLPVPLAMAFLGGLEWPFAITLSLFSLHTASLCGQIAHNETWKPQGWNAFAFLGLLIVDFWYTSRLFKLNEWYDAAIMCLMVYVAGHDNAAMLVEKLSPDSEEERPVKLASTLVPGTSTDIPCDDIIAV